MRNQPRVLVYQCCAVAFGPTLGKKIHNFPDVLTKVSLEAVSSYP